MKQIVVISGKGGTGKTVITAALASCMSNGLVVDCDVDASNVHLLLSPEIQKRHVFKSGETAVRDASRCISCGACFSVCRFEAISPHFDIDGIACEGCGFCTRVCSTHAISMQENTTGEWYISKTRVGPCVHARLGTGEENSGKLVHTVRSAAKEFAEEHRKEWVLIDGSPGIGCPVIASLTDVDCALVVTEPTVSGIHDAKRVIEVAHHFKTPVKVVVNKCDINPEMTQNIRAYCDEHAIACIAEIPFDENVVHAVNNAQTIMECERAVIKDEIRALWHTIEKTVTQKRR